MLKTHKIFRRALTALLAAASIAVAQDAAVPKPQPATSGAPASNIPASHPSDLTPMSLVQPSAPSVSGPVAQTSGSAPGSMNVVPAAAPVATPATAASPAQAAPAGMSAEVESGGV